MKEYNDANVCYDKALELDQQISDVWYYKGSNLNELQKYAVAIECFDKAIELDPENVNANVWGDKGTALYFLREYNEAINHYNKALQINPETVDIWKAKGYALRNLELHAEAITCFDKSQKLDPEDENIWLMKGHSLSCINRDEEAIACFDRVLQINPNDEIAINYREISKKKLKTEKTNERITEDKIEKKDRFENDSEFQKNLIELVKHEEYDKAIEILNKAINLEPNSASLWYDRGNILSMMLKHQHALECFNKVIEIDPDYQDVKQKKEEKIRAIEGEELIKLNNTENGLYWYTLAENRLEEEKRDIDTLNAFENALKFGGLVPLEEARTNAILAMMYGKRDMEEEKNICLKRALQLNDNYGNILREKYVKLYVGVCLKYAGTIENTDEKIRLMEIPKELGFESVYDFFDYNTLKKSN